MSYLMFECKLACHRIRPSAMQQDVPFFEACLGVAAQAERGSGVPVDPCSKHTSDRRPPAHWAATKCRALKDLERHLVLQPRLRLQRSKGLPFWLIGLQRKK